VFTLREEFQLIKAPMIHKSYPRPLITAAQFSQFSRISATGPCHAIYESACVNQSDGSIVLFLPSVDRHSSNDGEETIHICYHHFSQKPQKARMRVRRIYTDQGIPTTIGDLPVKKAEAVDGALFLGCYSLSGSLWHVVLDMLADLWQWLHHIFPLSARCPRFQVFLTNEELGAKNEHKCIFGGCGPWADAHGLSFYRALTGTNVSESVLSIADITTSSSPKQLTCYRSIIAGYPLGPYPFNKRTALLRGFGECMLANGRRSVRRHHPRVLIVNRAMCGRKLANSGQLRRWLVSQGYSASVLLFELLPRDAQLEAARDADVLVAPHGSALGWMTVMPRGGVVIEASVMTARTDYEKWSEWVGVSHVPWVQTNLSQLISCRTGNPIAGEPGWKRELNDVKFAFPLRDFSRAFSRALEHLSR
jgi:hypothetical protein